MSSPLRPGASVEEELDYYKKQYEQLESDLADFQASSKELEEQLERDVEAAEKNERKLKEQIEKVKYEAEEWKTKHQQSKTEANNAQNTLQKEITTMRDTNRTLQLKLRDIEVMNDDYERQARNTESSLEDMEGKHNVAIERGVMLEEELKNGEQEREALRIETQRLRDELGDLKVENEITLEKLRLADETIERLRSRKPSPLAVESLRARSPGSEASGVTPSSPTASTPPPKSDSASDAPTPPSPPLSDTPANGKPEPKTPMPTKRKSFIPDVGATPKPGPQPPRTQQRQSGRPSAVSSSALRTSDAKAMKPPARPRVVSRESAAQSSSLPQTDSLYQIRSLRGRMQKIEERVHSARSKLPTGPRNRTPNKNSPSAGDNLPSSITMRRSIKRPSSNLGSQVDGLSELASPSGRRESGIKRPSFGVPRPSSVASNRPASALDRPPSSAAASRPSSRTSTAANIPARSSSSISGSYAAVHGAKRTHRPSASISELRFQASESEESPLKLSPERRTSTALPTPSKGSRVSGVGLPQRNRTSFGGMRPPPPRKGGGMEEDLGETY